MSGSAERVPKLALADYRRYMLAALLAAPLALPALPQNGEIVALDPVTGPGVEAVVRGVVAPHPDGGVVSAFASDFGSLAVAGSETMTVRRSSDLGDAVWTTVIDTSAPGILGIPRGLAPRAGGGVAVLSSGDPPEPERVDLFGADGTLLWTARIDDVDAPVRTNFVAFAGPDQVAVAALASPGGSSAPYRVSVRFLDVATGVESARYEVADATDDELGLATMDGDAVLSWSGATGLEVARVAPDGTEVFRTPTAVVASIGEPLIAVLATDQRISIVTETRAAGLDPAGTLLYETDLPAPPLHTQAVAVSPTDFATLHGCCWVSRIGADGSALWTHLSDGVGDEYSGVAPAPGDEVLVQAYPASTDRLAYEWLGAGGAEVARFDLPDLGSVLDQVSPPAVDARGNIWTVSREVLIGFAFPDVAYVTKIAAGVDRATPGCAQPFPNSTGVAGRLAAIGSADVERDNLTLVADDLPPGQFTLFLNARNAGLIPGVGGSQAVLCLDGQINRYVGPGEIRRASPAGRASLQLSLAATPEGVGATSILAGETWHFQAWHRDPGAVGGSHMSASIAVTFL